MGPVFKKVGVLMLETQFPRLPGDIGNPNGLGFPVIYETVKGASPEAMVREQDRSLLNPFIDAGQKLVKRGAGIISTSCGFLAAFQNEMQAAIPAPLYTSSLLQLPELEKRYGKGAVGILTISSSSMTQDFKDATGIESHVPVGSTEGGSEFTRAILNNETAFDQDLCAADNVLAAQELVSSNPGLRALLLECTNMAPHSEAIGLATGLPVYSLNTLLSRHSKSID